MFYLPQGTFLQNRSPISESINLRHTTSEVTQLVRILLLFRILQFIKCIHFHLSPPDTIKEDPTHRYLHALGLVGLVPLLQFGPSGYRDTAEIRYPDHVIATITWSLFIPHQTWQHGSFSTTNTLPHWHPSPGPQTSMASGACSWEVRVMQEPSCERFRQPDDQWKLQRHDAELTPANCPSPH